MPSDQEIWNDNAAAYDDFIGEDGDLVRRELIDPKLTALIGAVKGKKILDAGCGNGYFSNKLANAEGNIIGVDFSDELLVRAKKRFPGLEFKLADLTQSLDFPEGNFDCVVCHNVLMDLPDLEHVLKEFYRVLNQNGVLVFSVLHPCFSPPVAFWKRRFLGRLNKKWIRLYSKSYFSSGVFQTKIRKSKCKSTNLYHRTLQEYFDSLKKSGFRVSDFVEPRLTPERVDAFPGLYQFSRFPPVAIFRAVVHSFANARETLVADQSRET